MTLRAQTVLLCALASLTSRRAVAQSVAIDTTTRFQTIDGFGTCLGQGDSANSWWQQLYFQDMQFSVMRMDLTPNFMPDGGVTTDSFCSPWYANAQSSNLYLPQSDGGCGPNNSCTREYTGPTDYSNAYAGCSSKIAVMGPDIAQNVAAFDFGAVSDIGAIAQMGAAQAAQLGDFKLYASLWSPAPWVKLSSGDTYPAGSSFPSPTSGTPWPFIWGGNFAGGILDLSGTAYAQFNDGTADTTSLTQFTRLLAAYLKGFQDTYGVSFYAISLQNELDFEEFYNSMLYPVAADYITVLKAVRAELDAQPDLANIKIYGPEDVIGGDAYGMYMYGSAGTASERDKNLAFLNAIAADPAATSAIGGFNIHGYAADGVSAAGANSQLWDWWVNGWTTSPAAGIPANLEGFSSFGKPSWMTETSGEAIAWLSNDSTGFPSQGAFGLLVGLHETLVAGDESAFLYWQFTDGASSPDGDTQALTGVTSLGTAPKYNAMKHFARYIRPGSVRVAATVTGTGASSLLASAYVLDSAASLTIVLINENATAVTATVSLPATPAGLGSFQSFTSSDGSYWNAGSVTAASGSASVSVPGYGVVTLYGVGVTTSSSTTSGAAASTASGTTAASSTAGTTASSTSASTTSGSSTTGRSTSTGSTAASNSGSTSAGHGATSSTATSGSTTGSAVASTGSSASASSGASSGAVTGGTVATGVTTGDASGSSGERVVGSGCGCTSAGGDPLAGVAILLGLAIFRRRR